MDTPSVDSVRRETEGREISERDVGEREAAGGWGDLVRDDAPPPFRSDPRFGDQTGKDRAAPPCTVDWREAEEREAAAGGRERGDGWPTHRWDQRFHQRFDHVASVGRVSNRAGGSAELERRPQSTPRAGPPAPRVDRRELEELDALVDALRVPPEDIWTYSSMRHGASLKVCARA